MPDKLCEVTVVDCYGVRRTIRVEAESTYRAAMAFYTRSRANPTDNLPLVGDGTVYEVKMAGDDKVYLVGSSPDVAMANRVADRAIQEEKGRPR